MGEERRDKTDVGNLEREKAIRKRKDERYGYDPLYGSDNKSGTIGSYIREGLDLKDGSIDFWDGTVGCNTRQSVNQNKCDPGMGLGRMDSQGWDLSQEKVGFRECKWKCQPQREILGKREKILISKKDWIPKMREKLNEEVQEDEEERGKERG